MKNFFKKNWLLLLIGTLLALCLFVGLQFAPLFVLGSAGLFVVSLMFFLRTFKTYKTVKDYNVNDDYFDATQLDYDEDVYYVGSSSPISNMAKGRFSKITSFTPCLFSLFFMIAFGFLVIYGVVGIISSI